MTLRQNILIAYSLALRDIRNTYARSFLGPIWMLFTPLLMLLVYWAVFGLILNIEWRNNLNGEKLNYILPFFAGLALYLYLTDMITSSLKLYVGKRAYVQRTPVPLWVIWLSNYMRSTLQFSSTFLILVLMAGYFGTLSVSGVFFALIVVFCFMLFLAAISLVLSVLGPFFGDIENTIGPIMRAVFYSAPITYPLTFVPAPFSSYLMFNPLSVPATELRRALIENQLPHFLALSVYIGVTIAIAAIAIPLHLRLRKVVSDVI